MGNKQVKALVITGNGTNCEMEMAQACRLGGADVVDIVHISALLSGETVLDDYHFLNLPGGFLDGDDLGSAKANATRLRYARTAGGQSLFEGICRFVGDGKLILGICNGFQLLVKLGLIPALAGLGTQETTLTYNDSGKFVDRWVWLHLNENSPCVFTRGLKELYLPVRHGEGKFVTADEQVLAQLREQQLIVAQYSAEDCAGPVMDYPLNPNGSVEAIAGICDITGRVFGMMPHAEAYLHYTNHPRWSREQLPEEGQGVALFRNAVDYIRSDLLG
ncbi:MAG: phosphoribosylformylglycinamidine synthase subunit PurQ [Deltaproteobacteria bacterium]|nr:phosphoribosylformylglycinamidine synthase subunit PurQ [Deltaproteobacteria bacterium]